MEKKTLAKDEEKSEVLNKISEIEEAYLDLMKAYFSCLDDLKSKKLKKTEWFKQFSQKRPRPTEVLLTWNILAPRVTKWNIRRRVDFLWAAFLLLITQNRNKIDSEIIKRFELYYGDMNDLSTQFKKSGLIAIFYAIIPAITVVTALVLDIITTSSELSFVTVFLIVMAIFYLVYFFVFFLIEGFKGCKRIFEDANVPEREKEIFLRLNQLSEL